MKISAIFDFRNKALHQQDVGTVSIRIFDAKSNKRLQFLSTGVRCRRSEWSDSRWVVNRPDAAELNQEIRAAYDEAVAAAGAPLHSLRHGSAPFLDWLAVEIGRARLATGTIKHHRHLHSELESWGRIKTFRDVNRRNIASFLDHLASHTTTVTVNGRLVQQPISQVTICSTYRRLAKWVHLAQAQDLVPTNALTGIKVPRGQCQQREHFSQAEMNQWMTCELPYAHLIIARDLFTVQAGTGLAYGDLMTMDFSRIEKVGEFFTLTGRRQKTGKSFYIVILPWAKEVIDYYNGQLPRISNQKYNDYLKQVAAYAHIYKKVSSHVGRHTYACLCLSAGVRIEAVQRTLGHADIRTTQIYAKLVDQDVLAAFENTNLFNSK